MNFDFPTILVLGTLATGGIWAFDALFLARRRRLAAERVAMPAGTVEAEQARERARREPTLVEYSRSLFPVILAVLLLRSFLVEPFRIPSGSMMPTLLVGDFILVNKYKYGLRLPVLNERILDIGEPKRGDVVVFRYPQDPSVDYIKRVVGLPGDRVTYVDRALYINGERVKEVPAGTYVGFGSGSRMTGASVFIEHLGKVEHEILIEPAKPTIEGEWQVPEGQYFVMGDNRDNSNDSRFWGTVPEQNLVGKAFMIWMSWDLDAGGVNWGRIGDVIE
jgi:signal peptidase I